MDIVLLHKNTRYTFTSWQVFSQCICSGFNHFKQYCPNIYCDFHRHHISFMNSSVGLCRQEKQVATTKFSPRYRNHPSPIHFPHTTPSGLYEQQKTVVKTSSKLSWQQIRGMCGWWARWHTCATPGMFGPLGDIARL